MVHRSGCKQVPPAGVERLMNAGLEHYVLNLRYSAVTQMHFLLCHPQSLSLILQVLAILHFLSTSTHSSQTFSTATSNLDIIPVQYLCLSTFLSSSVRGRSGAATLPFIALIFSLSRETWISPPLTSLVTPHVTGATPPI